MSWKALLLLLLLYFFSSFGNVPCLALHVAELQLNHIPKIMQFPLCSCV